MPTYLVELYVARAGVGETAAAVGRLGAVARGFSRTDGAVRLIRTIFVPEDETCFCLFEAGSLALVERVAAEAGIASPRVLEATSDVLTPTGRNA